MLRMGMGGQVPAGPAADLGRRMAATAANRLCQTNWSGSATANPTSREVASRESGRRPANSTNSPAARRRCRTSEEANRSNTTKTGPYRGSTSR